MFTKDHAKEIFQGTKKLLKMSDVKFVNVIKFDELSVKNLYNKLLVLDGMEQYFPNKYPKGRKCDRLTVPVVPSVVIFSVKNHSAKLSTELVQRCFQSACEESGARWIALLDAFLRSDDRVFILSSPVKIMRIITVELSKE